MLNTGKNTYAVYFDVKRNNHEYPFIIIAKGDNAKEARSSAEKFWNIEIARRYWRTNEIPHMFHIGAKRLKKMCDAQNGLYEPNTRFKRPEHIKLVDMYDFETDAFKMFGLITENVCWSLRDF